MLLFVDRWSDEAYFCDFWTSYKIRKFGTAPQLFPKSIVLSMLYSISLVLKNGYPNDVAQATCFKSIIKAVFRYNIQNNDG